MLKYNMKLLTDINVHNVMSTFNVEQCIEALQLLLSSSNSSSFSLSLTCSICSSTSYLQMARCDNHNMMNYCDVMVLRLQPQLCDHLCMYWNNYLARREHHVFHFHKKINSKWLCVGAKMTSNMTKSLANTMK